MNSLFPTTLEGWIIVIIMNIVWTIFSYNLAKKKNKDTSTAIIVTILLGVFATVYYIFAQPEIKKKEAKLKIEKFWYKKWWVIIFLFAGLVIISFFLLDNFSNKTIYVCPNGSQVSDSSQCSSAFTQTQENLQNDVQNIQTTSDSITTPVVEEQSVETTMGERNALSKALSYLDFMAFSYSGLIKQLEYEGFTYEEAVYGVDNCDADWNEQALLKSQSYLDFMAFSYSGLIKQLEYEGFTKEQAEYGADNCDADWNEQASLKAQSYLDFMAFSREGLIEQLEYEGFTKEQAEYGVQAVGY